MTKSNILTIQINPIVGEKQTNLEKVKRFIVENSELNPDLIIMPEFFNTGINEDAFKKLAEEEHSSETIAFFSELAIRYNTNIHTGAIIEREGDKLYNTSFFIDRNGKILGKYRKIHLFDYFGGNEGASITPGNELVVLDSDIGKIGMSICFDLRFPLHYNKLMKQNAEILVCPSAWALAWLFEWELCNQSLALDNAAYFVSSCLCGESYYEHAGNSMIVEPTGKIIARAGLEEGIAFAQINVAKVREARELFPVLILE